MGADHSYAHGFFEAARVVNKRASDRDAVVDTLVYPACFNFRHGIELYVKYGISSVAEITGSGAKYRANHSLLDNWIAFKTAAHGVLDFETADITLIDKVISCFSDVDPNGQIFRYPGSIKADQHLKDCNIINLTFVSVALDRLTAIFHDWRFKIEAEIEYRQSYESYDHLDPIPYEYS